MTAAVAERPRTASAEMEARLAEAVRANAGLSPPSPDEALDVALSTICGADLLTMAVSGGLQEATKALRSAAGSRFAGGSGSDFYYQTDPPKGVVVRRAHGAPSTLVPWARLAELIWAGIEVPGLLDGLRAAYSRFCADWPEHANYRENTDAIRRFERLIFDAGLTRAEVEALDVEMTGGKSS